MKTKMMVGALLAIATLLFSAYQPGNAVTYYGHDGSVDKSLTKIKVEKMKNKGNVWVYIVKACPDYNMAVGGVILKSDMEQHLMIVNKNIKKGDCSYYGATMKAKDGKTLGAEIIEKHEALAKYNELTKGLGKMNSNQKTNAILDMLDYRKMLGGLV